MERVGINRYQKIYRKGGSGMIEYPKRTFHDRMIFVKEEAKRKYRVWRFRHESQKTYKDMERNTNIQRIIRRIFK